MLRGLDLFKQTFERFNDQYVLIGGAACTVALGALAVPFRATKDLDIVLCIENLNVDFGRALWDFIRSGKYENQESSAGKGSFYRFGKPLNDRYPFQLELFSRTPDTFILPEESRLTPIPLDDELSSLSAILLNDDYYTLIQQNRQIIDGISLVTSECLIALKAKAFIDLFTRKNAGEQSIDTKNIRKHRNDIARIVAGLPGESPFILTESLREDMSLFLRQMETETIDMKSLNLPFSHEDFLKRMRQTFLL